MKHIEHYHRMMEERARCWYEMLSFNYLPRMMVVHLIITSLFYINAFVWMTRVSNALSPLAIVEGAALDYNLHFRMMFGEYFINA